MICALMKQSAALSKIDYLREGIPNEFEVSSYDLHQSEELVVKRLEEALLLLREENREPEAWALQMREGWWVGIWNDRDIAVDIAKRSKRGDDVIHGVYLLPVDQAMVVEKMRREHAEQIAAINRTATESIDAANERASKAELALFDHSEQQKKLVREIDVAMHGDDAAEQASLCDIVLLVKRYFAKRKPRS